MLGTIKKERRISTRLQRLIETGENEMLDFKKEITDVNKIAKTIVSFANHKGGTILVGVNDDKTLHGVNAEEEKHMLNRAAELYCNPQIEIEMSEHAVGKKSILEVVIPSGTQKPYYAKGEDEKWGATIRVKDQSILASKVLIEVLKRENRQQQTLIKYSSKEQALLNYLDKTESITLKEFCRLQNISRRSAQVILVNLVSIGVLRLHSDEKEDFFSLR
ncbi:MAG: helix-turn-helix domain-containing protein [Bacteroidia bacterium]